MKTFQIRIAKEGKHRCLKFKPEFPIEVEKEYKSWLGFFKSNNVVENRITIIKRDSMDKIISIKNIIKATNNPDLHFLILSKDNN